MGLTNRTGNPLPAPTGSPAAPTVGPFMIYPMRAAAGHGRAASTLGDYLDALYRRKWLILALVAVSVLGTWRLSKSLPKLYEATATLDVDRLTPGRVVGPESLTQVAPDMDQYVATHVRMLSSDAVLRPVALKYKLKEDEGSRSASTELRPGPIHLRSLKIVRPPNTYLIQITYRHRDAETAAAVANAIAATYVEHLTELRESGWSTLSSASRKQLDDLRTKMETSNAELLALQRRIGMVDPEDKTNVWSSRLLQLNTDYARAQADLASKQAAYDTLRSGVPEAAEASVHGELLKKLIERRAETAQKFSDVKALYGENHPEYKRLSAQLKEVDGQLDVQYKKAVQRAASELRESRLRETNLRNAYQQSKLEADQITSHSLEFRMLRQRAEADRALYEELSRKVGEAEINSGLRITPVRLADAARPESRPATPNVALNCAVALLASLIIGCVGAVLLETRRLVVRATEDLKALCGTQVVAALPSVPKWRRKRGLTMFATQNMDRLDPAISRFREEIRMLRNGLTQSELPPRARVLAVVSPASGEGRSRIAMELATAMAVAGKRTLLIDANLRSPVLHTMFFSTGPRTGLSTAMSGESAWRQSIMQAVEDEAPDLLPSGAPDDRSFDLMHQRLFDLLDDAESEYDSIIVDCPPFLRYSESLDIARAVDAVVAVGRAGVTDPREFETMLHYLQRVDTRVAAVALNDISR